MHNFLKGVFLTLVAIALLACSKANDKAASIDPLTGKHPANWAVSNTGGAHPAAYLAGPSVCNECHGKDLAGGISRVSCFSSSRSGISCHPGGPTDHPDGWALADVHGASAKAVSSGKDGYAHCQFCHGSDFSGGIARKSCLNSAGCHGAGIMAAHSPKPWRSTIGERSHSSTDSSNAAACAVCHTAGLNSGRKPSVPAPAGTLPGCYNNTLCHGVEGHATGWSAASVHGAAAKSASGGEKGFRTCSVCHGTDFTGGSAQQTCLDTDGCHGAGVKAPHPISPWRSASGGLSHTTTDTGNASQCVLCHTGGNNSTRDPRPGDTVGTGSCFNNTLCHGTVGHAVGWKAANAHGAEAKKAPSGSTGFSSCQSCHGSAFNNGSAPSCLNNLACHGSGVNSPHARKPWFSRTGGPTHTTSDQANVPTCAICHTGGANSTIKPPDPSTGTAGCFNNTLCHFHQIPYAPSATIPPSLHGGEAKKNLTICQNCHGTIGTTAFNGVTLADGTKTITCSSCHTIAKAHPTDWQGSGTYSHRTAGNIANACSICHDGTQGRTAPLAAAPSCFSTTFANGAGQSRTCHAAGPGVAPHNVPYNNHNATARSNFNYCLGCHQIAANAAKPPGCQNCHLTSPVATAVGCTSCHVNPPGGTTYPNIAGLHARHSSLNAAAVCSECHNGLGFGTVDHLNRARARASAVQPNPVVFGTLAKTGGLAPTYTALNQQCTDTYCHGNSLDKPASAVLSPLWTAPFLTGNAANDCSKCHGYPPATLIHSGKTPPQCIGCHPHVNGSGTGFTDSAKHINGTIDAIGAHGFPNPGSLHLAAANGTGCITAGCHAPGAAGSPYPVAVGTPPDCRACHLGAIPTTNPRCSDCHGASTSDATTNAGRPGGSAFPNRQGGADGHNRGTHRVACTRCHLITTGNPAHGWSSRTKSANAQVVPALNWVPGTRAPGQGSCNPTAGGISGCHGSQSSWY